MYETFELGPMIDQYVPNFSLCDHEHVYYSLDELMGQNGMLLGFIGDIWHPISVRRVLWLQRHVQKFAVMGTPVALLIRDYPHTLYGFHMSSPLPVPFPLLADSDGHIHKQYCMDRHPGLLLIDREHRLREKWLMPDDRVWPKLQELSNAVHDMQMML